MADPLDPATARAAVLRWDERSHPDHAGVLTWYRALIALRRSDPALATGEVTSVEVLEEDASLVLRRGPWAVAVNLSDRAVSLVLGARRMEVSTAGVTLQPDRVSLPPGATAVLRLAT